MIDQLPSLLIFCNGRYCFVAEMNQQKRKADHQQKILVQSTDDVAMQEAKQGALGTAAGTIQTCK